MKREIVWLILILQASEQFYYETVTLPDNAKQRIHNCKSNGISQGVAQEDIWQLELACLASYYSNLGVNERTEKDRKLFEEAKESRFGFHPPPTGFRTRQEVRTLSAEEWEKTADVFVQMYKNICYDEILQGLVTGINLAWVCHGSICYGLSIFEEEMRKIDPTVSLPYWDYTADFYIAKPEESVVWTDCFFGSNSSVVSSGYFADFYGAHYSFISRNANSDCFGKLISHQDIAQLLEYCSLVDITTGISTEEDYLKSKHNLELLHDGVHDWVGGDMGIVQNSGFDPVFYMHHAYIDYIFEEFRQHQVKSCNNVDLESEYRPMDDMCRECNATTSHGHGPYTLMVGYPNIRNIDGLWLNWTTIFYNYAPRPSCPDNCNGEFLFCNTSLPKNLKEAFPHGVCVTKEWTACEKHRRNQRASEDTEPLEPKFSCSSRGKKIQVLNGDGRNRRMSEQDSWEALQQYFDSFLDTGGTVAAEEEQESKLNIIGITFGTICVIETLVLQVVQFVSFARTGRQMGEDHTERIRLMLQCSCTSLITK